MFDQKKPRTEYSISKRWVKAHSWQGLPACPAFQIAPGWGGRWSHRAWCWTQTAPASGGWMHQFMRETIKPNHSHNSANYQTCLLFCAYILDLLSFSCDTLLCREWNETKEGYNVAGQKRVVIASRGGGSWSSHRRTTTSHGVTACNSVTKLQ